MSRRNKSDLSLAAVTTMAAIAEIDKQIQNLLERRAVLAERAQVLIMGEDPDRVEIRGTK